MKFRPCIDLHAGQVKQIVGSTLTDDNDNNNNDNAKTETTTTTQQSPQQLSTNFTSERPASYYAELYRRDGLTGGHVIMLGPGNTEAAGEALRAYPQGLQVGGGVTADNAREWLDVHQASHVIVTSYVFHHGRVDWDRLRALVEAVGGRDKLVLDLSCRRRRPAKEATATPDQESPYYVVTDRWQTYTDVEVNADTLRELSSYCAEFLVHGVENEGKRCGILEDLVVLLGQHSPIPVTYAGGVRSLSDLDRVYELGRGRVDLTIGSALDCFGGDIKYDDVVEWHRKKQQQEEVK